MKPLVLLFALTGCVSPGTDIEINRDPETGAITVQLERGWLAGPVDIEGEYTSPDGTHVKFRWKADLNLDAAAQAYALQQANLGKALDLAAAAASAAGGVP